MDRRRQDATRSTGENDIEKQAQHLAELMRSGEIEKNRVEFAAFLGYEPAQLIIPEDDQVELTSSGEAITVSQQINEITFQGRELMELVSERFGEWAYIAMSLEPLRQFAPAYEHFLANSLNEPDTVVSKTITVCEQYLQTGEVDSNLVRTLRNEVNAVITRFREFTPSFSFSDLAYAYIPLEIAEDCLQHLRGEESSIHRTAYGVLFTRFFDTDQPISPQMWDQLPDSLRDTISTTQNDDVGKPPSEQAQTALEQAQIADKYVKKMLKESGLKWALKDVK